MAALGFDFVQEGDRINDLQKPEAFLKLAAFLSIPPHPIEQLIVATDQIGCACRQREVDVRPNFGIERKCVFRRVVGYA